MKKILAVLLALILIAITAAGCGRTETPATTAVKEETEALMVTEEPAEAVFALTLDGVSYARDAEEIYASSVSADVLDKLPQMTALAQVTVTGYGDGLEQLRTYCDANGIAFRIELEGEMLTDETAELTVSQVTEEQVHLLALMPNLRSLHFQEPEASAEALLQLRIKLPEAVVTWEKTVLGMTFSSEETQIDLTPVIARAEGEGPDVKTAYEYGLEFAPMGGKEEEPRTAKVLREHPFPDKAEQTRQLIAEAEAAMAYFPNAEKLLMCGAWLENEEMSQFRECHREDYKVVWSVLCGDIAPRTDTLFFMPTKYYVTSGNFNDLYSGNLKYCEDIISMDIGHMHVADISFLRYMPNLKYLVLFSQPIYDLSPLADCKNLVYLELSKCEWISDYTPLQGCTALEDLNVEYSAGDFQPLLEMTWLKNLHLGDCGAEMYWAAREALPETRVGYTGNSFNWRTLPNYFKMRDALLMFYMD